MNEFARDRTDLLSLGHENSKEFKGLFKIQFVKFMFPAKKGTFA